MKCYNCPANVPEGMDYCPRCGAHQGFTQALIDRAKMNDQYALSELYNKTYSNVYYTVISLVKDEDTALDLMQDSYLKAFANLDQIESPEKFGAWIKRIAHNRSIDYLRQKKPVLFSQMEDEDGETSVEFEDEDMSNLPEAVIDRRETERLLREILDELPEEQRTVITMHYYEEIPVKEIAAELGVSENTVKSRLNYGRKKIESKVRALEKKGTKLYGLSPLPFLVLLFRSREKHTAKLPPELPEKILPACTEAITANTAKSAAGSGFFSALKSSLLLKIVAGTLATFLAIGGVTTAAYYMGLRPDGEPTPSKPRTSNEGYVPSSEISYEDESDALDIPPTEQPTQKPTEMPTEHSAYVETYLTREIGGRTWQCPRILLDSADAQAANNEIVQSFNFASSFMNSGGTSGTPRTPEDSNFYYKAHVFNDILSLYIHQVSWISKNIENITVYNFDVNTGQQLNNDDVTSRLNTDPYTSNASLENQLNAYYENLLEHPESNQRMTNEDADAYTSTVEMERENTLSEGNLQMIKYGVSDNGLRAVVPEYVYQSASSLILELDY